MDARPELPPPNRPRPALDRPALERPPRPGFRRDGAARSLGVGFWALVVYFFVEYVRPQSLVPALGGLGLGMLSQLALIGLVLFHRPKRPLPDTMWGMVLVLGLMAFGVPFADNMNAAFTITRILTIMFVSALIGMYFFLNTIDRLDRFMGWFLTFNAFVAVVAIRSQGEGTGSFLTDENDLCLALNVAFPIAVFRLMRSPTTRARLLYGGLVALFLTGVVVSLSRGGFLGALAAGAWIWWKSPHRLLTAGLAVVLLVGVALMVPPAYWEEMATINEAARGAETGGDRLYLWSLGLKMFAERPVLGWGANNFPYVCWKFQGDEQFMRIEGRLGPGRNYWGRVAHSVYVTVLSELGLVGVGLFTWLVYRLFRDHHRLQRALVPRVAPLGAQACDAGRLLTLSLGLDAGLIGYLVSGVFLSAFYYPHLWVLLTLGAIARDLGRRELGLEEPAEPPAPILPGRRVG